MPYKCLSCEKIYDDFASEVGKGCNCGSRLFFYLTQDKIGKIISKFKAFPMKTGKNEEIEIKKEIQEDISEEEKGKIKDSVSEIKELKERTGVVVDFETIRLLRTGKYSVNIRKLFGTKEPRIYKLEDGKYVIDFDSLHKSNIS